MKTYTKNEVTSLIIFNTLTFLFLLATFIDIPFMNHIASLILFSIFLLALIGILIYVEIQEKKTRKKETFSPWIVLGIFLIFGVPALLGWAFFEDFRKTLYFTLGIASAILFFTTYFPEVKPPSPSNDEVEPTATNDDVRA